MRPTLAILQAMLYCPYKAWRFSNGKNPISTGNFYSGFLKDDVAQRAWRMVQPQETDFIIFSKGIRYTKKAQKLLAEAETVLSKDSPPAFYKIPPCSVCQFKEDCFSKLRERDCISLLAGMTPKVVAKYLKRGITTITQLSHLFRPRRNRRVTAVGRYLYELKALAIREHKTFGIHA